VLPPGSRQLVVSIPTRSDHEAEPAETLTLRLDVGKQRFRRTVRVVDAP